MDAEEFFTRREQIAHDFECLPRDVPAEAVWYLASDQSLSVVTIRRAQEMLNDLVHARSQRLVNGEVAEILDEARKIEYKDKP